MENAEIINARNEYFNKLKSKNEINHCRIDEIDLDNVGICLNRYQVDLINLALNGNKANYKKYQDNLLDNLEYNTISGKRKRYIMIIDNLSQDEELPEKVRLTLKKISEQTKSNINITTEMILKTINLLFSKLSTDLQKIIYNKINKLYPVATEGIKDMKFEEALKLLTYIENDYTSITIVDSARFINYCNQNDTYNLSNLETMLNFAYDNDKQVRISSLITSTDFPSYLKGESREIVKQKLISYVDNLTKYLNNYNLTHKRVDRKPVIRSIDVFEDLITNNFPYEWKNEGWQNVLSLQDLCNVIAIARKNLPNVDFVYNENIDNLEKIVIFKEIVKYIKNYESKNNIKLMDTIGIKFHASLDVLKDDIINIFKELKDLKLPIAITEFSLHAPSYMVENNGSNEIEILRDRFISDFSNLITNLSLAKEIKFDSINVCNLNDEQDFMLTEINKERRKNNLPPLKTIYGGIYDNKFDRKEINTRDKNIRKRKRDSNNKGKIEGMYVFGIVIILIVIIAIVCYVFVQNL